MKLSATRTSWKHPSTSRGIGKPSTRREIWRAIIISGLLPTCLVGQQSSAAGVGSVPKGRALPYPLLTDSKPKKLFERSGEGARALLAALGSATASSNDRAAVAASIGQRLKGPIGSDNSENSPLENSRTKSEL